MLVAHRRAPRAGRLALGTVPGRWPDAGRWALVPGRWPDAGRWALGAFCVSSEVGALAPTSRHVFSFNFLLLWGSELQLLGPGLLP